MRTITENTKLKESTWVKISNNNIQLAIIWADKIDVESVSFGKHYVISDGDNGVVGFAYTPATIAINESCEIELPVNQEVKP